MEQACPGSQGLIPGSPSLELSVPSEGKGQDVRTRHQERALNLLVALLTLGSMEKEKEVSASDQPSRRELCVSVKKRVPFQDIYGDFLCHLNHLEDSCKLKYFTPKYFNMHL